MTSRDRDYASQRDFGNQHLYGRDDELERDSSYAYRNQTSRDRGYASAHGTRDSGYDYDRDRPQNSWQRDGDFRRYNPYRNPNAGGYSPDFYESSAPQARGAGTSGFDQSYGGRPAAYDADRSWRDQQASLGYPGRSVVSNEKGQAFDPDYQQWRDEQIRNLDSDYETWRKDRYKKFSDEFNTWRSSRSTGNGAPSGSASEKSSDKPGSSDSNSKNR